MREEAEGSVREHQSSFETKRKKHAVAAAEVAVTKRRKEEGTAVWKGCRS
jgi:hypothetical protein